MVTLEIQYAVQTPSDWRRKVIPAMTPPNLLMMTMSGVSRTMILILLNTGPIRLILRSLWLIIARHVRTEAIQPIQITST